MKALTILDITEKLLKTYRHYGFIPLYVPVRHQHVDDNSFETRLEQIKDVTVHGNQDDGYMILIGTLPLDVMESNTDCPHCGEKIQTIAHVGGGRVFSIDILPEEKEQ